MKAIIPRFSSPKGITRNNKNQEKRTKTMMTIGLTWPDAKPIVLHSILNASSAISRLSPHEVLVGRPGTSRKPKKLICFGLTIIWSLILNNRFLKRLQRDSRDLQRILFIHFKWPQQSHVPTYSHVASTVRNAFYKERRGLSKGAQSLKKNYHNLCIL